MIEERIDEEPSGQSGDPAVREHVARVEPQIAQVCGVINAAQAQLVEHLHGLLRDGGWCQGGVRSPEHYVMWQCGVSRRDAHRVVGVARRLGTWRRCAEAFAAGELSLEQAHLICECDPPPWADETTCQYAKVMTLAQLRRVLRGYSFPESHDAEQPGAEQSGAEQSGAEQPGAGQSGREPAEQREAALGPNRAGGLHLEADLPVDEGEEVRQAMQACREDLFHRCHGRAGEGDCDCGEPPSGVTWADALVEMARRSLAFGAAEHPGGGQHRVWWHYRVDPEGKPLLQAHRGVRVPDWMQRLLLCDTTVAPVAETDTFPARGCRHGGDARREDGLDLDLLAALVGGTPVSVGRAQRIVPDRLRRFVEHRDGGCRIPGCTQRNWLRMHHIVWWGAGGRTDSANIMAVCGPHHRAIHRGELSVSGDADDPLGLRVTDANGRPLRAAPRVVPPSGPPGQAAEQLGIRPRTWRHPLGETLHYDDVYFNHDPRHGPEAA